MGKGIQNTWIWGSTYQCTLGSFPSWNYTDISYEYGSVLSIRSSNVLVRCCPTSGKLRPASDSFHVLIIGSCLSFLGWGRIQGNIVSLHCEAYSGIKSFGSALLLVQIYYYSKFAPRRRLFHHICTLKFPKLFPMVGRSSEIAGIFRRLTTEQERFVKIRNIPSLPCEIWLHRAPLDPCLNFVL